MTNLKKKRQEAHYTQHDLAARACVSVRTLQYYEQGVLDINKAAAGTVYRIAEALGCHVEDLLEPFVIGVDLDE